MKAVCLALAVPLLSPSHTYARNWRVYSPPQSGFNVETPAPLRTVKFFEGEHGAAFEPDQAMKGASFYAAVETTPKDSRFGIIAIDTGAKVIRPFRREPRRELLDYLRIFIGDDDRPDPEIERAVDVNGLKGKEYFYMKEDNPLYTRGRIFDTGRTVYVIVFVGQKRDDLTSPDAERFLNSFRPRSRTGKVKVRNR